MSASDNKERDISLLQHMLRYSEDAMDAAKQAGTIENFETNRVYQHAVAMCVLEIGELAKHLSEEFLKEHSEMPWRAISRMRDLYAHHYHKTDARQLWATATEDLTVLRQFCQSVLQ